MQVQENRKVRIVHTSRYTFDDPLRSGAFKARLRPRELADQHVTLHQIILRPRLSSTTEHDAFGNDLTRFAIERPLRGLEVHALSEVEVQTSREVFPKGPDIPWEEALSGGDTDGEWSAPALRQLARRFSRGIFPPAAPLRQVIDSLSERLESDLEHDSSHSRSAPQLEEVFEKCRGVCLDRARVAVACLRDRGFQARFAGGYLLGPLRLGETHRCEAHAWAQVWHPRGRWIDVDPHRLRIEDRAVITVSRGAEPGDIDQLTGRITGGCRQHLDVEIWATALE